MKRRHTQRGIVLPLLAIALVAILAMAALALDVGDSLHEKGRVQNALDAAALAGAKVIDAGGDTIQADSAARGDFAANTAPDPRMAAALAAGKLSVTVEFSNTLDPFVPGSTPARFVRVGAGGLTFKSWFANVVGVANRHIAGTAVAGPSPVLGQVCNVVPMVACGDPGAANWGYSPGTVVQLKSDATTAGSSTIGPGNFQLIRLGASGANATRAAMAGEYNQCLSTGDTLQTEPGNQVSVAQGLNTRLGIYTGPFSTADQSTYRPDLITTYPNYYYSEYKSDYAAGNYTNPVNGEAGRRMLTVPIGYCTADASGQTQIKLLGYGCFYLLQPMKQKGNQASITGQFEGECDARGVPGPAPVTGPGPHRIQLYKDPDSVDS